MLFKLLTQQQCLAGVEQHLVGLAAAAASAAAAAMRAACDNKLAAAAAALDAAEEVVGVTARTADIAEHEKDFADAALGAAADLAEAAGAGGAAAAVALEGQADVAAALDARPLEQRNEVPGHWQTSPASNSSSLAA